MKSEDRFLLKEIKMTTKRSILLLVDILVLGCVDISPIQWDSWSLTRIKT